jgi:ferrous iron transport protein B
MKKIIALIGNQNSGKTTLFNHLTGSNQHVGNFPGVTVEKKSGVLKKHPDYEIVDLPGIYSLSPYSSEEVLTRNFLIQDDVAGIINIVDATNLERNLYLTLQIAELGIPTVIALNMMDEVQSCGNSIHAEKLPEHLGMDVVPISASKHQGIDELLLHLCRITENNIKPLKYDFCDGEVHRAIHAISHIVEAKANQFSIPVRFAAAKIVEGDTQIMDWLHLSNSERDIIEHISKEMEDLSELDREALMADMRYRYIESICKDTVSRFCTTKEQRRTVKIDRWLTHKFFAIPLFLTIMSLVFFLSFGFIGSTISSGFEILIDQVITLTNQVLTKLAINPTIHSLIVDGALTGIGSVLSFLPLILLLFFFLSILEDTGYMARIAFVMDRLLRKIGLSGKSFVPMLIGFGCSVPAVMATRTLLGERDKKLTMILIPFMSCSAKLPIYALFTAAFFPSHQTLVMISLYFTGMGIAILVGLLLKNSIFKGDSTPFILELPAYRFPSPTSVFLHMYDKAKDFIRRAFTIIFLATIVIWFLQSFDFRLNQVTDSTQSILAGIGLFIAPIFSPLGFGNWQASTAILTGLSAKEAVVSTMAVLLGTDHPEGLFATLKTLFQPLEAFSFLVFTLLYMPCVATLAAIRREMNSLSKAGLVMLFQTAVAWITAFAVYRVGLLLGLG